MNDPMQPEELTELLDDDLEMWAVGGTRILTNPRSQANPQPQPQPLTPSYPPVAYTPASIPPPPVAPARSNAAIWAVMGGMVGVFGIAAIGGAIALFVHRSHAETEAASTVANASTVTTAEPEAVTLTPAVTVTATATATVTAAPTATTPAAPVVVVAAQPKLGMVQTWAVGNGKPIYVDGKQVGVGGGRVKTACGKHSVAVGAGRAKTYDIPCSGAAIVVGTPDGQ